jgi:uncharacterized protein (DUF305 family)
MAGATHTGPEYRPAHQEGDSNMTGLFSRAIAAAVLACVVQASPSAQTGAAAQATPRPEPKPRPDLVQFAYTDADVNFMAGMIPHHAQAVAMATMAPTHASSPQIKLMCERQLVSQRDEIEIMRTWLRDRSQRVPAATSTRHRMVMNGMEHDMLMPGMLSDEEMAELDKARGDAWDKLFLKFMIKHHEGALKMVEDLFNTHGAAQGDDIYAFASDIFADQTAEIERMQKMLAGG